jgi:hypothetical protein
MNMKSILTYLATLTLTLTIFTVEAQEVPTVTATEQIELNRENSPVTHIVNSHRTPQASAKNPSEFITALTVYLIIIIVYSIYGFKANTKNIEH